MFGAITGALKIGGAIAGGIGANQRASAQRRAIAAATENVKNFTKEQIEKSDKLGKEKQTYLESGDPFAEMGRFIFGDPSQSTFQNLRKAQSDFSELAAGKTANFSKEVASIVQGALANTFGGPRGSFENLSAKNLFSFRQGGLQSALGLTDFFNRTGSQLTNAKFGILDQTFERQLALRQNEINQINQLRMGKAETAGTGWNAFGNALNAGAGAVSNFGLEMQNQQTLASQQDFTSRYLSMLYGRQNPSMVGGGGSQSTVFSSPSLPPSTTDLPSGSGGYDTTLLGGDASTLSAPVSMRPSSFLSWLTPSAATANSILSAYLRPNPVPVEYADPSTPQGRQMLNNAFR